MRCWSGDLVVVIQPSGTYASYDPDGRNQSGFMFSSKTDDVEIDELVLIIVSASDLPLVMVLTPRMTFGWIRIERLGDA